MQKIIVESGQCVSCGRYAGMRGMFCPYCGDPVFRHVWWLLVRYAVVAAPPLLTLYLLTRLKLAPVRLVFSAISSAPLQGFLLAGGLAVLLFPPYTGCLIVGSREELEGLRNRIVARSVLAGVYGVVAALSLQILAFGGGTAGVVAAVAAVFLYLCVGVAPLITHTAWLTLVAVCLMTLSILTVYT